MTQVLKRQSFTVRIRVERERVGKEKVKVKRMNNERWYDIDKIRDLRQVSV